MVWRSPDIQRDSVLQRGWRVQYGHAKQSTYRRRSSGGAVADGGGERSGVDPRRPGVSGDRSLPGGLHAGGSQGRGSSAGDARIYEEGMEMPNQLTKQKVARV